MRGLGVGVGGVGVDVDADAPDVLDAAGILVGFFAVLYEEAF